MIDLMFYKGDIPYPVTIIQDRYSGSYSDGQYLAFNLYPGAIPDEVGGGDMIEMEFWAEGGRHEDYLIGKGETPNLALMDLLEKIEKQ